MSLPGVYHSLARRVGPLLSTMSPLLTLVRVNAVNDMLIAILNCCTKEELDEVDEEELHAHEAAVTSIDEDEVELDEHGQKVIKDKIMLVGKMSRVFALLR